MSWRFRVIAWASMGAIVTTALAIATLFQMPWVSP
jgi:hypothetical protein